MLACQAAHYYFVTPLHCVILEPSATVHISLSVMSILVPCNYSEVLHALVLHAL